MFSDRLTGWPCVAHLGSSLTSKSVIRHFRRWFAEVGVPQSLSTDGGPQFSAHKFSEFCRRWQVEHVRSTPHYPQSNGHAESSVKAMKLLIEKTTRNGNLDVDDFQRGLLEWRNTPREGGQSPAQMLFGRPLSSFIFAHHSIFAPKWQAVAQQADDASIPRAQSHYDKSARPLKKLIPGAHVDIQHPRTKLWSMRGVIVAVGDHRDYFVKLPSGRVYWRNRRFLRPYVPPVPDPVPPLATSASHPPEPSTTVPDPSVPHHSVPRHSNRHRRQHKPFNISSTAGQSYT